MRGRGLARRRTATSWRSTRSSTSFAEDVRPISTTSPSTWQKIKYSTRRDTLGSCLPVDHRWSATLARVLAPRKFVQVDRVAGRVEVRGTAVNPGELQHRSYC